MSAKQTKILIILISISSVTVVVFCLLKIFGIWENALYVSEPMMGIVLALHAVQRWKTNRWVAVLLAIAAVCMFVVTGVVIFLA